jgi:hypothetical protein
MTGSERRTRAATIAGAMLAAAPRLSGETKPHDGDFPTRLGPSDGPPQDWVS